MAPEPNKPPRTDSYQVKVLDKAIDILDAFTMGRRELSVPEIVEITGVNRSTAIRLIANLERRGLLQRASSKRRFRLGQRLFEMGSIVYSSFSLREAAAEPLSELQQQIGGTILVGSRNGEHTVIIERRQGVGGLTMASMPGAVGNVHPLTYGPIGHVILATLDPEVVDDLLERYPLQQRTPYSLMDHALFLERLPQIRRDGYAMEINEVVEGLMGLATPILDFAGNVVGGVALGFPATRENDAAFVDFALQSLKHAAAAISANMGYVADDESAPDPADEVDQDVREQPTTAPPAVVPTPAGK